MEKFIVNNSISATSNIRYDYVDIAKGLCILAVVWGHIVKSGDLFLIGQPIRMPLFFMVSGMLFKSAKYNKVGGIKDFIRARAKRLLLPYVIYSVVTWVIWALYNLIFSNDVESYFNPLLQTVLAQGSGQFLKHNSPLWFIPCLFVIELMYFYICKLKNIYNLFSCFILAGIGILCQNIWGNAYLYFLPWNFDAALMALPIYCMGNLFVKKIGHKHLVDYVSSHKIFSVISVIVFTAILYASVKVYGGMTMGQSYYGNLWLFYPRAIIGCLSVCIVSIFLSLNKNKLFSPFVRYWKWAGINSFDIMATHVPLKGVLLVMIFNYIPQNSCWKWMFYFMVFLFVMFIDTYLVIFINKYIKTLKFHSSK